MVRSFLKLLVTQLLTLVIGITGLNVGTHELWFEEEANSTVPFKPM
jgi:hypothetical protein